MNTADTVGPPGFELSGATRERIANVCLGLLEANQPELIDVFQIRYYWACSNTYARALLVPEYGAFERKRATDEHPYQHD